VIETVLMDFTTPLQRATLVKRYKRFLADVQLPDGKIVTAHCANPGAMLGLAKPGASVWLAPNPNPKAKLGWRWMLEEVEGAYVGINTTLPNILVREALAGSHIPPLAAYRTIRSEVAYHESSRIDFLLQYPGLPDCYVEVKNAHLKRDTSAEFPDCPTARGAKHLEALMAMHAKGARCVMLYVVQRTDVNAFKIARDLDPHYAEMFTQTLAQGVECYAYRCEINTKRIVLAQALPVLH
jgi:sugar fermentation stimulation protein A